MKFRIALAALAVPLLLAGCSLMDAQKVEYKSTGKMKPLEVPPDLTQPGRDDRYVVPDITPKGGATFSAYSGERAEAATKPVTGTEVLPTVGEMRIERAGTQRWLVVPVAPEKLWQTLKDFWQDNGFTVNTEQPVAGVMETDWAENRAKIPQGIFRDTLGRVFDYIYSTPERDKFRTRLERGAKPGETEVYVSHRGMYEIYINEGRTDTRWQPRPADPDLEAEMLRRLMVRLGMEEVRAKTMIATAVLDEKAKLLPNDAGLQLNEPFDRAWRRVGLALDRVGFAVEDRDRSQGIYFVRYIDPEAAKDDDSFLSKLAFWRDKTDTSQKPKLRVHVAGANENSIVDIQTADGTVDSSPTGKKVLHLLHDQLK